MINPRISIVAGLVALALSACATQAEDSTAAVEAAPAEQYVLIGDPFPPEPPPPPPPAPTLPAMTDAGSITLFEGGCYYYSSCETFEVTLRPDGSFTVSGQNGAAGREGQIGAEVFAATEAFLANNGFAALPERMDGSGMGGWTHERQPYPCVNHAPGTVVTRRPGDGSERRIYWSWGCPSAQMTDWTARLRDVMRVGDMLTPPPG